MEYKLDAMERTAISDILRTMATWIIEKLQSFSNLLYQKQNVTVESQRHYISPLQTAAVHKSYIWLVILLMI